MAAKNDLVIFTLFESTPEETKKAARDLREIFSNRNNKVNIRKMAAEVIGGNHQDWDVAWPDEFDLIDGNADWITWGFGVYSKDLKKTGGITKKAAKELFKTIREWMSDDYEVVDNKVAWAESEKELEVTCC